MPNPNPNPPAKAYIVTASARGDEYAACVLEAVAKVERMQLIIEPYCLGGWVRKVNDYHDMNTRARTWLETVELSKEMDWERKKYDN